MHDTEKTPAQLIAELTALRQRVVDLEAITATQSQITERQQAVETLQQAHDALEQRVAERTAALQAVNAQLRTESAERQRTEAALQEREARYRDLFENASDVVYTVDLERYVTSVNKTGERILGYTRDEMIGKHITDFLAPEYQESLRPIGDRIRTGPTSTALEIEVITKTNQRLPLEVNTRLIYQGGQAVGVQGIARDITERKRAEVKQQRLETQLHQVQKMESIGTLAGGIAHEFNNILGAMLGFADLAQYEVPQGGEVWQYLQEVLTAGRRAKGLVQQILSFSRQSEPVRQPLQVSLLIKESLSLLRASLPATIEIRQEVDEKVGHVLADRTQMHQVLMNFCANAEYAMRETGGTLTISADSLEVDQAFAAHHPPMQAGPYGRITIRDTGYGMDPKIVERIFDPFFTTKDVGEGTGMGLAVVHGIVTSHGGAVTVESVVGMGTTFQVYLPQANDIVDGKVRPEEVIPGGKARILFVDDEDTLARLGKSMLERLGYDVVATTSSLEALNAFHADPQRFHLIITDQTMSGMTGEHLVRAVRDIRADMPIILCTGFSHAIDAEKAKTMEIDAFLMKPLMIRDLAVTIQQVLVRRAEQTK